MRRLHILKTEPDETTMALISHMDEKGEKDATVIQLDDETDYEQFLDLVFAHDEVISWW